MAEQELEQGGNILVVDDDIDSRTWARMWLKQDGHTVREAKTGQEALDLIADQIPDLILMDVMLPDTTGFELTRRLRQEHTYAFIPIIIITVLDDMENKVRGLEAGANDFLSKPAKQTELQARVRTLLRLKRNQEELFAEKEKIALLYRISHELNTELDLDTILSRILELTISTIGASRGSLILLDEGGGVLRHIYSDQGVITTVTDIVRGRIVQKGLAGWVIQHRQSVILEDASKDARWLSIAQSEKVTCAALCVPLLHKERVVGVLTLSHEQVGYFTAAHMDLLQSIASQSSIALLNAQLFEAMEQERGRLKAILSGTVDAIVATDSKLRLILLNPAAERAFGFSLEQVAGWPLPEIFAQKPLVEAFRSAQEENGPARPTEITLPDGRTLFFTVSPVSSTSKGEGGWVAVMRDITYLKEANRLKNEFVSTVSHDLRTPLATIHGYAEVLLKMADDEGAQIARRIQNDARRLANLVEELLDLGKIEAGVEIIREPCPMDHLATEAVEAAQFQARESQITLEATISPLSGLVWGNPIRLRQVLDNLLSNALKYTPAGGAVDVHIWEDTEQVMLTVQDSGIGIPQEALPRLFEKFYRVPDRNAARRAGTGLGLAIVRAIVEQHGGQIWVESELGEGSTFGVSLPYCSES